MTRVTRPIAVKTSQSVERSAMARFVSLLTVSREVSLVTDDSLL